MQTRDEKITKAVLLGASMTEQARKHKITVVRVLQVVNDQCRRANPKVYFNDLECWRASVDLAKLRKNADSYLAMKRV